MVSRPYSRPHICIGEDVGLSEIAVGMFHLSTLPSFKANGQCRATYPFMRWKISP